MTIKQMKILKCLNPNQLISKLIKNIFFCPDNFWSALNGLSLRKCQETGKMEKIAKKIVRISKIVAKVVKFENIDDKNH